MYRFDLATATNVYERLTEQQLTINREFCRVLALVMRPTPTLARLRFYMGTVLDGGGLRVTCSDPAVSRGQV